MSLIKIIHIYQNLSYFFLLRPDPIYPTPQPDKTAAKCRKDVCQLPDCSCGGKEIPGKTQKTKYFIKIIFVIIIITFLLFR